MDFVAEFKNQDLHVKITLNSQGYPCLGTERCFSARPDMRYSDDDLMYLDDVPETPTTIGMEDPMAPPPDNDLPF